MVSVIPYISIPQVPQVKIDYSLMLLGDRYGTYPLKLAIWMVGRGASKILDIVPGVQVYPAPFTVDKNANADAESNIVNTIYGYDINLSSANGRDAQIAACFLDVSRYSEILVLAELDHSDTRYGGVRAILADSTTPVTNGNFYGVTIDPNATTQDFRIDKYYNGTSIILAVEAVDIQAGVYPVALYYRRSDGLLLAARNGTLKLCVTDTDISVKYVGVHAWTPSANLVTRRVNRIVVYAL